MKKTVFFGVWGGLLGVLLGMVSIGVWADNNSGPSADSNTAIMQQFVPAVDENEEQRISDQSRHQVLFFMGALLLILVIATASLGVAMVLYKKQVYVAHMLCAGLAVTLAIAHAVAAMVWFYPF